MVLLDTHLVLWAALSPQRLPRKTAKLLASRNTAASFSVATLWEVAIKSSLGRSDFDVDADALHRWLLLEGFSELAISASHVKQVATLPWHHRDPFDRLLIAQAQVEGLTLWTADRALKAYGRSVKLAASLGTQPTGHTAGR